MVGDGRSLSATVVITDLGILHLCLSPSGCDEKTWRKGCVNKIPFCKNIFIPSCDCASLHIVNDFNLTALPDSLVDEMTGLRKVFIRRCNLTALPQGMEKLEEMVDFEVSYNKLKAFDVNVLKWKKLDKLILTENNITRYNKMSVWTHPGLAGIAMAGNVGLQMPATGIFMPSLNYLNFEENKMAFNSPFEDGSFPQLIDLYLSGNHLTVFPGKNLHNILYLGIARCGLIHVPKAVLKYHNLQYLDARDNNITAVSTDLRELIAKNKVEAYFSGNLICKDDSSLDCVPLCSKTCWSRNVHNDGYCDMSCRTRECDYDGGDCT